MKVAGLFAGIGGFELGLRRAGHETVLTCECWAPAIAVLAERLAGVPNHPDIRELLDLPEEVELVCGGFPCQDLSQAGKTIGIGGARSGLVHEVFRLLGRRVAAGRPVPWVLLENVSFMLHLEGGRAMERLVHAFEELGYRWAYRVVNSLGWLPQRRERVFFLASRVADPADVLLCDEAVPRPASTALGEIAHGFYWTEGIRGLGWAPDAVPTLKNGSSVGIPAPPAILMPDGRIVKPDIRDAERLQGFDEDWTEPAARVAKSSWRWSLVGNAVSVPVAAWLGSRLAEPDAYDPGRDRALPIAGRWPRAARFDGRVRYAVEINDFPIWRGRPPLADFLRYPGELLSARATAGFLERTDRSSLRFPEGFREAVRAHLERVLDGAPLAVAAE
ncbi:MAG: DNA (cytosine-5-)-methyltransferase [Geminicoccaceae bacterium]|nr:DNA (cytosine-5-)-methyltransferase [Geminicoccaceae bacterium]MCX7631549.1 DNA (cytosine-5-)-methyltransferase [Geminicoccaceae bacterium]MDW8369400.1 DNA (cytosine-5-)-methyltransferase [Geminicoccaceae bacterium]